MESRDEFHIVVVATLRDGRSVERVLTPDEYFDEPEDGEALECNSTPRYLEVSDYLDERDVEWVRLTVTNTRTSNQYVIEERFWGGDLDCRGATVQEWRNGNLVDWEQTLQIQEAETGWLHIVKMGRPGADAHGGVRSHTAVRPREGGDEYRRLP